LAFYALPPAPFLCIAGTDRADGMSLRCGLGVAKMPLKNLTTVQLRGCEPAIHRGG
jgi:hypothetical protein